jgi:catechol 2,3-dioxygenase-like lactoylglutathione lyase family enzyme
MVDDQDKALRFYTKVLGFQKKHEFPMGAYKWLTVVSPEGLDDLELALEPHANPAAKTFQRAMFAQSIPLASFEVADIQGEYARLKAFGVAFTCEPMKTGQ